MSETIDSTVIVEYTSMSIEDLKLKALKGDYLALDILSGKMKVLDFFNLVEEVKKNEDESICSSDFKD